MNRAQKLKSGDISLGLAHEWICAFGRQGGTAAMLQVSLENQSVMKSIVDLIKAVPIEDPNPDQALNRLMRSIDAGVQCENGIYTFHDPGLSFSLLQSLPIVKQRSLISSNLGRWIKQCAWPNVHATPCQRRMRLRFGSPSDQDYDEVIAALPRGEHVASAREVATLLVVYFLSCGERLLPKDAVYTGDQNPKGEQVLVGCFMEGNGLIVSSLPASTRQVIHIATSLS